MVLSAQLSGSVSFGFCADAVNLPPVPGNQRGSMPVPEDSTVLVNTETLG